MRSHILIAILIVVLVSACNSMYTFGIEHPSTDTPPSPPASINSLTPAFTPLPAATLQSATATLTPEDTSVPITETAMPPVVYPASPNFIDDRSSMSQLIISYYNAINRHEYLRAYSYWIDPATELGSFTSFADGYQDTSSVDLVFGQITAGAGAGQVYYTVPVILKATANNGTHKNWAACYVVHQSEPDLFSEPPFYPLGIAQGSATPSDINANDAAVLDTACSAYPSGSDQVSISGSDLSIDKTNYLDNRSGPIETVSSMLNALNSKQYARAYYYFQAPANYPGPFDPYAAGYSDTDVITAVFGTVQSDAGAGQLYYKVPLAMKILTTSGATQTFVGCYTLHQSQPAVQATPPFQPMGIIGGKFKKVDNNTNVNSLLPAACN